VTGRDVLRRVLSEIVDGGDLPEDERDDAYAEDQEDGLALAFEFIDHALVLLKEAEVAIWLAYFRLSAGGLAQVSQARVQNLLGLERADFQPAFKRLKYLGLLEQIEPYGYRQPAVHRLHGRVRRGLFSRLSSADDDGEAETD
jgi:hypothetical protein